MSKELQHVDVAVVGAGPAGLSFARALAGSGLEVRVIDPADAETLAKPAFDGREIALTHASRHRLEQLDIWSRLPSAEISALRDAWVFDGDAEEPMRISHQDSGAGQLGFLVPNHRIREAAFAAFQAAGEATLIEGRRVESVERGTQSHRLRLSDGRWLSARLVVAADSRFSSTRRAFGIAARQRDFGRSMLVCRMRLERDHEHVAWEWFGREQTLALLPLNGREASAVITLPHGEIERLSKLDDEDFNREVSERYQHRLGAMQRVSQPCLYPLVGVWPDRLVVPGFACIGDAAVGMHPVTAHGFNLGLASVDALSQRMLSACRSGGDFAADSLLQAYQREHRRASAPLYLATGAVVGLYTSNSLPARWLRRAALRGAGRLPPFRRLIARTLTDRKAA
ncbi:MAG: 5-demethoxyubiquinol-8 5-hydroxylase UbiM [Wenzhouxiangella sp.]